VRVRRLRINPFHALTPTTRSAIDRNLRVIIYGSQRVNILAINLFRKEKKERKNSRRDTSTFVTSCPIGMSLPADSSCEGRVSLHFTQSGLSMPAAAGVVDEKGSEYILAHTGPRELDGHPLGGCGSGFGLVPGYTTLLVRVRANT